MTAAVRHADQYALRGLQPGAPRWARRSSSAPAEANHKMTITSFVTSCRSRPNRIDLDPD